MNPVHRTLDDDARANIAEYAFGTLGRSERDAMALHLEQCALCSHELSAHESVAGALLRIQPGSTPSNGVFARILARTREMAEVSSDAGIQVWRRWAEDGSDIVDGFALVRSTTASWEPTGIEGVDVKQLFVDRVNDRATMLVRMAPGTVYPGHRHAAFEECFVVQGDLRIGDDVEMNAGDYQRAEKGSVHPAQSTRGGCLLLIVSSFSDELIV